MGEVESQHTQEVQTHVKPTIRGSWLHAGRHLHAPVCIESCMRNMPSHQAATGRAANIVKCRRLQVSELVKELAAGGAAALDVTLDDGLVPRLLAYSRSVAGFPTAVKEVGIAIVVVHAVARQPLLADDHPVAACGLILWVSSCSSSGGMAGSTSRASRRWRPTRRTRILSTRRRCRKSAPFEEALAAALVCPRS